ncbi:hypothetical protein RHGRI_032522 [Rhododendron griersonianum]|uniref:F-box domain-containing protein n=1 Tax=Rhododendron griersonianum TaxID=479676 RepID=A0AAV6ICP9_9ERIC|nr:hypothetical protein RHGRI_032522 [Rhododendron griersonianum]
MLGILNSWYNKIAGSPPPTSFTCLPNDLILKIMASLPSNDVARMACVCSRLRCLASDDDLWKHMFLERFGNTERLHGEELHWKEKFTKCWKEDLDWKPKVRDRMLEDLSKENIMLRKLLAEKSVPPLSPRGAWKDKVGDSSAGQVNLEFIPPQVINDRIVISPPADLEDQPKPVLVEEVGTSIQAGPGSLGGTKPAVAVSPTREGSPMVLGSSPVLPMSVPTILRAKAVARSPSRIRSCDDATIEKVEALTSNIFSPLSAKETVTGGCSDTIASSSAGVIEAGKGNKGRGGGRKPKLLQ